MKIWKQTFSFFKSIGTEMRKVSWMKIDDVFKNTGIVLLIILLTSLFFLGVDYVIGMVMNLF